MVIQPWKPFIGWGGRRDKEGKGKGGGGEGKGVGGEGKVRGREGEGREEG